jgi:uncharacterized protein
MAVKITFDPDKRARTLKDRGIDFMDAGAVFSGPTFTRLDDRAEYPEQRFITAGLLGGRMVVVVWTPTADGRRIIPMRKANAREQARFEKRLEQD